MTGAFRLHLDTTAPSVVWGGTSGTTAGEVLRVQYVSDEPLDHATLILADGRRLTLSVLPDHVEALLPPDAPDGWAGIEVRDDVDNRQTYAAVVQIAGVGQPPLVYTPAPSPGFPGPRPSSRRRPTPEPRTVVVISETSIAPTSVAVVSSTVVESEAAVSSSTATTSSRRTLFGGAEPATAVSIRVHRVVTSDSGRRLEREAIVRRRDSPDTELILLL